MLPILLAILAAAPRFNVQTLHVEGEIFAVVPTDLDCDGKKDLASRTHPSWATSPRSRGYRASRPA